GAAERGSEGVDEHDVTAEERHQDLPVTSVRLSVLGTYGSTVVRVWPACRAGHLPRLLPAGQWRRSAAWQWRSGAVRQLRRSDVTREHESSARVPSEWIQPAAGGGEEDRRQEGQRLASRSWWLSASATCSICQSRAPSSCRLSATASADIRRGGDQARRRWYS